MLYTLKIAAVSFLCFTSTLHAEVVSPRAVGKARYSEKYHFEWIDKIRNDTDIDLFLHNSFVDQGVLHSQEVKNLMKQNCKSQVEGLSSLEKKLIQNLCNVKWRQKAYLGEEILALGKYKGKNLIGKVDHNTLIIKYE